MFVDANDKATMLDSLGRNVSYSVVDRSTGLQVAKVVKCDDVKGVITRLVTDHKGSVLLNGRRDAARTVTQSGRYSLVANASHQ